MSDVDRELVALLRAGDRRGFDLCYDRYRHALYGFLLRLSGQRALADDLYQETWLRLARSAGGLRPDSDLRAWLFTVARNAFHGALRAARHQRLEGGPIDELSAPSAADQALELSELERALLGLPLEERELLLLVAVEGIAQDELARQLCIQASALRQRVRRARAHLAALLEAGPKSEARKRTSHG